MTCHRPGFRSTGTLQRQRKLQQDSKALQGGQLGKQRAFPHRRHAFRSAQRSLLSTSSSSGSQRHWVVGTCRWIRITPLMYCSLDFGGTGDKAALGVLECESESPATAETKRERIEGPKRARADPASSGHPLGLPSQAYSARAPHASCELRPKLFGHPAKRAPSRFRARFAGVCARATLPAAQQRCRGPQACASAARRPAVAASACARPSALARWSATSTRTRTLAHAALSGGAASERCSAHASSQPRLRRSTPTRTRARLPSRSLGKRPGGSALGASARGRCGGRAGARLVDLGASWGGVVGGPFSEANALRRSPICA